MHGDLPMTLAVGVLLGGVLLHAYTPSLAPITGKTVCFVSPSRTVVGRGLQPAMMVRPSGNSDPNFDPDNVDPEAVRRTVLKTGVVWATVGAVGALARRGC